MITLGTEISTTNIFCVIGKPGAGRETIVNNILGREDLCKDYHLKKLVYGTTRPMKAIDIDGETYHFLSNEEYRLISPEEIIEERSYDDTNTNKTYYYFTLKNYIHFGTNYIGKISVVQYQEIKKWAMIFQLKNPLICIRVFPVVVNASIFEREKRLIREAATDNDIYAICSKIITERFEFKYVAKDSPEIVDASNHNTCTLDNGKSGKQNIEILSDKLEEFIKSRI